MTAMRKWSVLFAIVLAGSLAALASQDEKLDKLIARAEAARLEERPGLYAEIAQRQVETADKLYATGDVETARRAVSDVVMYSDKARDASTRTGKRLKQTEIAVRKMAAKLRDIQHSLAFEDQAPVQSAVDDLEKMRTDLLAHMFGKKQKK